MSGGGQRRWLAEPRPHSAVGVELTLELHVELRPGGSDSFGYGLYTEEGLALWYSAKLMRPRTAGLNWRRDSSDFTAGCRKVLNEGRYHL
jgi:hypothetical protein